MQEIFVRFWHHRLPKALLLSLLMALTIATTAQATTGITLDRGQTLAVVLLAMTTLALSIYLFVIIFQPERF
jgi:F subunit of K+-transporting ATPase (Potass_KdpF)